MEELPGYESVDQSFVGAYHTEFATPYLNTLITDLEERLQCTRLLESIGALFDVRSSAHSEQPEQSRLEMIAAHAAVIHTIKETVVRVGELEAPTTSPPVFSAEWLTGLGVGLRGSGGV